VKRKGREGKTQGGEWEETEWQSEGRERKGMKESRNTLPSDPVYPAADRVSFLICEKFGAKKLLPATSSAIWHV